MPPKKTSNKPSTSRASASAMANCNKIPGNVMLCILTRLPVKSLCRFKCVSKPWRALFSSPDFITRHCDITATDQENHSFVIHSVSEYHDHVTTFLNVSSGGGDAVKVTHPFPELFFRMDLVGACNGLVCLACPPLGQMIVLWNPATLQWKALRLSCKTHENPLMVSLGLGFNSATNDFKVVMIECLRPKGLTPDQCLQVRANVYSSNTDAWKRVKLGFKFHVISTRNDGVVGGIPYWRAFVKDLGDESGFGEVFVRFNVKNGVFDRIPGPKLDVDLSSTTVLVEWKSCLAILVYSPRKEKNIVRKNTSDRDLNILYRG